MKPGWRILGEERGDGSGAGLLDSEESPAKRMQNFGQLVFSIA